MDTFTARDKSDLLVKNGSYVLVILANPATGDWALIDPTPVGNEQAQIFAERGLCFAGVVGTLNGAPSAALELDLSGDVAEAIGREFVVRVSREATHPRWCVMPDMFSN